MQTRESHIVQLYHNLGWPVSSHHEDATNTPVRAKATKVPTIATDREAASHVVAWVIVQSLMCALVMRHIVTPPEMASFWAEQAEGRTRVVDDRGDEEGIRHLEHLERVCASR